MKDNLSVHLVKEREIARARESKASPDVIGEQQHKIVGKFISKMINADDKLLEIGCGDGTLRKYVMGKYHDIDPIKSSECVDFDFHQCFGESSPFLDNYFDVIIIKDGINYYSNLDLLFGEVVRLLKPSGFVVFTEFVGGNYSSVLFLLKKFLKFQVGIMRNQWDSTYLGYYSHNDVICYAKKSFNNVEYLFNSCDERYFVVAANSIETDIQNAT
jgi:ubiquinone/menaquinone biosynthesis C-methylase UbiE